MNKLNVFGPAPYSKWNIWGRTKWFFSSIGCAWQRATKGYCYRDLWSLDYYYSWLFVNSLRDFKKNLHGAPSTFFDEGAENETERWENYLDEMAQHFFNSIDDNEVQMNEFEDDLEKLQNFYTSNDPDGIKEKWLKREAEISAWKTQELNIGLDMLKEVFQTLWD